MAAVLGSLVGACGGSGGDRSTVTITVLAASSLQDVFPRIASRFHEQYEGVEVRFSFAGTDALATQIRQGAPADVFAGASTKYGDQLAAEDLVGTPRTFATNRLVVVVPRDNPAGLTSPQELAGPGLKIVAGGPTVPVGAYTRTVLANLDALYGDGYSTAVLANVVSDEDNVGGVLAKVRLGEADAGFVYVTDALTAGEEVRSIVLPEEAQAVASYPIAVVSDSRHRSEAQAFVGSVLGEVGQDLLRTAGFGPPPLAPGG